MKKQLSFLIFLAWAVTATMAQTQTASPDVQTRQAELNTWQTYKIEVKKSLPAFPRIPQ